MNNPVTGESELQLGRDSLEAISVEWRAAVVGRAQPVRQVVDEPAFWLLLGERAVPNAIPRGDRLTALGAGHCRFHCVDGLSLKLLDVRWVSDERTKLSLAKRCSGATTARAQTAENRPTNC